MFFNRLMDASEANQGEIITKVQDNLWQSNRGTLYRMVEPDLCLRPCVGSLPTAGALPASHRSAAPTGAGWRTSSLRAPPPGADHGVPLAQQHAETIFAQAKAEACAAQSV